MTKRSLATAAVALCCLAAPADAAPAALRVKGSDTIGGELGPALARAFEAASPGVTVSWEAIGSATAFTGLLDGTAELGASSRSVSADELARAKELGVELREFVLGYDGVVVIVNPQNPVRRLTVPQLSALLSGAVRSWAELGGPDARPRLYGRPTYSGTHAFVRDRVVRRGEKGATDAFAPETVALEHSAALVEAVAKDPAAVAYVGMGWVRPGVVPLAVAPSPGAPPVEATAETVRSGAYPIARPLLLYTRGEPQGELRRLLQFTLAGANGTRWRIGAGATGGAAATGARCTNAPTSGGMKSWAATSFRPSPASVNWRSRRSSPWGSPRVYSSSGRAIG